MAGIYFIATGSSSRNQTKSLDQSFSVHEVGQYCAPRIQEQLNQHFADDKRVFAWGASTRGDLDKPTQGDYVVDVRNKVVKQVFRYAFMIDTGADTQLQRFIGWDDEKPANERRGFRYVYFLRAPQVAGRKDKSFFQQAFAQAANPQWLARQRWFSDDEVRMALERTGTRSLEDLLDIGPGLEPAVPSNFVTEIAFALQQEQQPKFLRPDWLLPVLRRVEFLRADHSHLEKEHEDIVTHLFEALGYARTQEIKHQRGRVDIVIVEPDQPRPIIVIEVKRDWALSRKRKDYVRQAHNYALEAGARWAILTNGDRYVVYDRKRGLSEDEQFECEFELTCLTTEGLQHLTGLRKQPRRDKGSSPG